MLNRILLTILLLITGLHSRAQKFPDYILFKSFAVQRHFRDTLREEIANQDSTKTLTKLHQLEKWAEEKDDIPLKAGIEITRLEYMDRFNHINEQTFENGIAKLLSDLRYNKMPMLEAELLVTLATHHWNGRKYVPAFEYSIKAYDLYSHFSEEEFPMKGAYTAGFGGMYYYFRDFNTAKKYHLEAVKADKYRNISMINTLGLCYVNLNIYDSAEYIFNKAYEIAEKRNDTEWRGLLSGNIGYMNYCLGDYDKAIPMLEHEVKLYKTELKGDRSNAATSLALLSSIYLSKSDKARALSLAQEACQLFRQAGIPLPIGMQKNIFPPLAKAFAANGNMTMAYAYLDSATRAKDSVAKNTNSLVLAGAQNVIDADKNLAEIQRYEHEQKIHSLTRNGLIIGILLLTTIGILLIRHQRLRFLNTRRRLETEKKYAETELNSAFAQLNVFTKSISEKNDLIEKFTAEIARMQKHLDPAFNYQNETLRQLEQTTILSDEQWENFQHLFEKAHKGFSRRLMRKAQGLSPVDIRFMLLCKLRLSPKEMSGIMGISIEAVRQNLDRLRHNLNLRDRHTLEDFADTI